MGLSVRPEYRNEIRVIRAVETPLRDQGRKKRRDPARMYVAVALAAALMVTALALTQAVQRPQNKRPVAVLAVPRQIAFAGEEVVFDASGSSDPDGSVQRWLWNCGDGPALCETGVSILERTFTLPGVYNISLNVRDDRGALSSAARAAILVVPLPRASARTARTLESITFSVDESELKDEPVNLSWNFSDGSPPAGGPRADHFFREHGNFAVALEVAWRGQLARSTVNVDIRNREPHAFFDIEGTGPYYANHEWAFNGTRSSDDDGSIVEWAWDFGDQTADDTSGPLVNHTFKYGGVFRVNLRVTDNDGANASMTREIGVNKDLLILALDIATYTDTDGTARANVSVKFDNAGDPKPAGSVSVTVTACTPGKDPISPTTESSRTEPYGGAMAGPAEGLSIDLSRLMIYGPQPGQTWYLAVIKYYGNAVDSGWYQKL